MSDYGFVHNGKVFTSNRTAGVSVEKVATRNKRIEEEELARWAERPDTMLAYYNFPANQQGQKLPAISPALPSLATVSTWLGTQLGTIITARVYRHNFGSRMVSITVKGSNGAEYYGRASWDHRDCITLHRRKSQ